MKIILITVKGITVTGISFTSITVTGIIVTGTTFTGIIVTGITDLKYYEIVANVQIYRSQITDTQTAITSNKIYIGTLINHGHTHKDSFNIRLKD